MKNNMLRFVFALMLIAIACLGEGCGVYSFSGAATAAKTIQVDPFYNNTDLAPANIATTVTNKVKDYFQQNSSLRVVAENGELQIEGVVTRYDLSPLNAVPVTTPGSTTAPSQQIAVAAQTRLMIIVKVNYVDNTEPKNSFKDKNFSFYQDFDSNSNFSDVQEDLETKIFNQILMDIFNATVANW